MDFSSGEVRVSELRVWKKWLAAIKSKYNFNLFLIQT